MLQIRTGERLRTLGAFAVLLCIVASYTLVKSVRDAVFLSRFSVTEISLVSVALAAASGLFAALYARVTHRLSRPRVMTVTHVITATSLVALAFPVQVEQSGAVAWTLFVWSSLFGGFLPVQFWLMCADLFDVREAKRLFGVVGAGAILGGFLGGAAARALVVHVGLGVLLGAAAGLLVVAALMTEMVWPLRRSDSRPPRPSSKDRRSLAEVFARPSYVRLLAAGLLLSTIVTTLLDWQLKAIAKHAYSDRAEAMASFFGAVAAWQSGVSLAAQLLLTGWLLRRHGVGAARLVLPLVTLVATVAILGQGALPFALLAVAAAGRVAEGSFRFAVDKTAMELSWLPLELSARERTKAFVDTTVDRLGTGVTGVLWLLAAAIGLDRPTAVHLLAVPALALTIVWIVVLLRTHKAYVKAFRASVERRSIDLEELGLGLGSAAANRTIIDALHADDPDQVRLGLYLLGTAARASKEPLVDLGRALVHPDASVCVQALELAREHGDFRYVEHAAALLGRAEPEVLEAAVCYLRAAPRAPAASAESFASALVALGDPERVAAASARIAAAVAADAPDRRCRVRLLAAAPPKQAAALLMPLFDDPDPEVVAAALEAAGRARATGLTDRLVALLDDRRWRAKAVSALADLGPGAARAVLGKLRDTEAPIEARRAAAWLLGGMREARYADALLAVIGAGPPELTHVATAALSRLVASTRLEVDRDRVERLVAEEADTLYRDLLLLGRGSWALAAPPFPGESLLERAVREACADTVERIFWLLDMLHAGDDVRVAFRGLRSPSSNARARSLELLDNVLPRRLERVLMPLFEEADATHFAELARRRCGLEPERLEDGVRRLLAGSRSWLRGVASWTIAERRLPIEEAEAPMGLTLVERALKLRGVDVLRQATSEDLAYVAQIANELEVQPETVLYREGDLPEALYVVVRGRVELSQDGTAIGVAAEGETFGSWALVDDSPRVATAIALETTTLLCIRRDDFLGVMADRAGIAQALLKSMVERIRSLAELAKR
jgi:AAA family ATP:ADP antiporter